MMCLLNKNLLIKDLLLILSLLFTNFLFGQNDKYFDTPKDYLNYLNKKLKIESSNVYYLSTESDSLNGRFEKFGIVLLITGNKITTINEVAKEIGVECSPNRMFPKLTEDNILNVSDQSDMIENVILKKMSDGQSIKLRNKKIALYTFSYRFGKKGKLFLKEKEFLERIGYKTIILSIDGAYIKSLIDIDKTPVYVK
ncbi:hypothetical protein [Mangrovimonas cancribranchiae]|uniref:Uncharacterized protein n=1 Tax=Mangrovimonas cancribranchiae TaxID=3080055 RepID=A0AAU6P042_9FLAO